MKSSARLPSRFCAASSRPRSWPSSAKATVRNTSLIGIILFGAFFLNYVLTTLRVPQEMAGLVTSLSMPSWLLMAIIVFAFIALGTFMEGFSLVVTTIPIIFPIVKALGYDPIWFGVIIVMITEIALISPPDGVVMYVLQGMRPDRGPITDVYVGVLPFFAVYVIAVIILMIAPEIVLWLPRALKVG